MGIKDIVGIGETTVLQKSCTTAVIDSFGAKCLALIVDGENHLFYDSEDIGHSGIPLCFPSFGPLKENEFIHNGQAYAMKQHGFARDLNFTQTESTETSVTYQLTDNDETKELFPFSFTFEVSYELIENGISIGFEFKNQSSKKMPLSPGIHPYFTAQDPEGILVTTRSENAYNNLNGYQSEGINDSEYLEVVEEIEGLKTVRVHKNPDHHLYNHNLTSTEIFRNGQRKILLEADQNIFSQMAIWRKSENSPFICVEPSNIQNGLNIDPLTIPPGKSLKSEVKITVF